MNGTNKKSTKKRNKPATIFKEYGSENVFKLSPNPPKKKSKTTTFCLNGDEPTQPKKTYATTPFKTKIHQLPRLQEYVSSSSGTTNNNITVEDILNNTISPSQSEKKIQLSSQAFKKRVREKLCDEESSDDICSDGANFSFSEFYESKSPNVSQISVHEGIEEELILTDSETELEDDTPCTTPVTDIISNGIEFPTNGVTETYSLKADYYDLPESKLVIIHHSDSIPIYGLVSIQVLYGTLEIFGHELTKSSKAVQVYSPRGSALLTLKNASRQLNYDRVDIVSLVPSLKPFKLLKSISVPKNALVLQCKHLIDHRMMFLEKHVSQQIFPRNVDEVCNQAIFEPKGNWSVLTTDNEWNRIISSVTNASKILIAGGKGVGKSTFLRYAINKLLNKFEAVRVIDLDPGQSEFTLPGCVAVLEIKQPIFGPNYTHLVAPDRLILSNINTNYDPQKYISSVEALLNYSNWQSIPTLINYMGFTPGIGLNIISSVVSIIQPTAVVEISSENVKKNFRKKLTIDTIKEHSELFTPNVDCTHLHYTLYNLKSMSDRKSGWSLEARQVREMCVLAYFGQMMNSRVQSVTSHNLNLFQTELSSLKITNLSGEEVSPLAAVANLVALCSIAEREKEIFRCHGWGIIRGIDVQLNELVLITPESVAMLEEVEYLVLTNVTLPPSIYMTSDDVSGAIPYVMDGELVNFGQLTKRSHLPVNKK